MTSSPRPNYKASIRITRFPWSAPRLIEAVGVLWDDAFENCQQKANEEGSKPPQRWQFWRKHDHATPEIIQLK